MKVKVKHWHAVAHWKWDIGTDVETQGDEDEEEDVCGICRVAFEGCCPTCKTPGDDCPLIWGQCTHVFHMHCLIKWIEQPASKQQCPMDRRPWESIARNLRVPSRPGRLNGWNRLPWAYALRPTTP
ncbi:zf-Apc11 domain-containing protein [Rhizoctonia solani AG-1 IA]|uniref:Anaphase-promoting complex subunit 11 n=1 Tax=Thanatephorus cucumeris (strain AG1-IA) TaxID=983506 RepID=L8WIQ2_THACA|nr:zf-Apc11 domain-containing protein [Rhizoctonia solani AG-1 IA]